MVLVSVTITDVYTWIRLGSNPAHVNKVDSVCQNQFANQLEKTHGNPCIDWCSFLDPKSAGVPHDVRLLRGQRWRPGAVVPRVGVRRPRCVTHSQTPSTVIETLFENHYQTHRHIGVVFQNASYQEAHALQGLLLAKLVEQKESLFSWWLGRFFRFHKGRLLWSQGVTESL